MNNIYAPSGTRVRFIGSTKDQVNWGGNDDPIQCGLKVGETYTVQSTEVHSQHTKVYLREFPGKRFNSVSFSDT